MFIPKKTKFKKQRKGKTFLRIYKKAENNIFFKKPNKIILKALSAGRLSSQHLLTCKQTINKVIKKYGRLYINAFACTPITKKPLEIRMGKGKGNVDHWIYKVKPGKILFEIIINHEKIGLKAFKLIQNKLPIATKILV